MAMPPPFLCCFCLNTGLCRGTLLLRQLYSPLRFPPRFGEGEAFSTILPLTSWPMAGARVCWGALEPPSIALHPCAGLCLSASRNGVPPPPGGEGKLCWLGSVSLGPACGGTCQQTCHQLLAPEMLQMLPWSLKASHPALRGCRSE